MSAQRKRSGFNERVSLAHERKVIVEENKRICRMERDAEVAFMQKQKRFNAAGSASKTSHFVFPTI